jgi:hypothetical protein
VARRLAKAYTGEHAQNVDVSVAVLDAMGE